ncbi:2486_t:CDS:2 [Cetraspora pellucida]|uniref:2486_t:CDS:1 n=1 Tax=Cetraspora pellucida TaxID=1433469 RepID=A0A9N9BCM6_9GLOM|nr:2486_t:CDS:2 [Cetraspora pellucida]
MIPLKQKGPGDANDDSSAMKVGVISQKCGLLYFEVIIINGGNNGIIGIGFCGNIVNRSEIPGN